MNLFIVGLGNPGRTNNPHNAGHRVIDHMLRILHPNDYFIVDDTKVRICKTDVLMNISGACIKRLIANKPFSGLWVVHDDLEVELGAVKWKYGGSAAGHNGLRSINSIYGMDYGRIRVGVGRPADSRIPISNFVTTDHAPDELEIITKKEKELAEFIVNNTSLLIERNLDYLRRYR